MTAAFPRLLLCKDWEPRHDQLITTYRGPEGSLTPIIVVLKAHRWWSYELIHSLTSSHSLCPPSQPVSRFVPPWRRLLHVSLSAPFHPLITLKCQLWPLGLTPKNISYALIWDIYSHKQEEVIIKHLASIYTMARLHAVIEMDKDADKWRIHLKTLTMWSHASRTGTQQENGWHVVFWKF